MPTRYVEECRAFTAAEPPALAALAGFLGMESPLPEIARVFYTRGGCWNLALALRAATGFPIELAYRDGVPVHAYVVVDDEALGVDAYGERPLQAARKTFDKFRRVSPAELLEELARAGDDLGPLRESFGAMPQSVLRFASSRRPLDVCVGAAQ